MGKFHDLMRGDLEIRGYSPATCRIYLGRVRDFVRFFMRPPDELTLGHINQYQLHLTRVPQVRPGTRRFWNGIVSVDWATLPRPSDVQSYD